MGVRFGMMRHMTARLWFLVVGLMALLFLVVSSPALAADTKLGNYEEAPYRDVVDIKKIDWGDGRFDTVVEIPYEYVFSPDKLQRTVTLNGREWEDLVIVSRYYDQTGGTRGWFYYVYDMFERLEDRELEDFTKPLPAASPITEEQHQASLQNFYQWLKERDVGTKASLLWQYPEAEDIVSINGRPWQETEWKDFIITKTKQLLKPGDPIMADPKLWDMFVNPAYNGQAREISEAVEAQGITLPSAEQIASETGNQVILTLGKKEVITYRDGRANIVTLDVAPEAPGGVTMVPLRGVLDFFGAKLIYDGASRTVTVQDGDVLVKLFVGEKSALVNNRQVTLLRTAEVKDGRTLIPLRFVGESLGYQVAWDQAKQQITIKK
ncbi:hypothetical protein SY88_00300 [Clostridiales bacterium PH28_bin88]|nr:hypothetical protein SY88_00300 [Clostridiales bacterium PH28_bin88]